MKVLIADDDCSAADALSVSLRMAGHEVETAYDGDAAVGLASNFLPEAAILDIRMHGKSGFEVAERMRALRSLRPGCLIAVTGEPADRNAHPGREAEFDYFLLKPTSPSQVEALLALCGDGF